MADYKVRGSYKMPSSPVCFDHLVEYARTPDSELDLQYRGESINVYYNGGSLLKISGKKSLEFDEFYFYLPQKEDLRSSDIEKLRKDNYIEVLKKKPSQFVNDHHLEGEALHLCHEKAKEIYKKLVKKRKDVCSRFLSSSDKNSTVQIIKEMKKQMLDWKNNVVNNDWRTTEKNERSVQQYISLYNKDFSEGVDYIVLDIEYALSEYATYKLEGRPGRKQPRLDVIALNRDGQLYVFELKYGMKSVALEKAGAKEHKEDFDHSVGHDTKWKSFVSDIHQLFMAKKDSGLIPKDVKFDMTKRPIFAFIMKCEVPTDKEDFLNHLNENGMEEIKTLFLNVDDSEQNYPRSKYLLSDKLLFQNKYPHKLITNTKLFSEILYLCSNCTYAIRVEGSVDADSRDAVISKIESTIKGRIDRLLYYNIIGEDMSSVVRICTKDKAFFFSFTTINPKYPVIITKDHIISVAFESCTPSLKQSKTEKFKTHELVTQKLMLRRKSEVFYGAKHGGSVIFEDSITKKKTKENKDYLISDSERIKNLYEDIQQDVVLYCNQEGIEFWHAGVTETNQVTNHILSSQIACFNHLFAIRDDKDIVLSIANAATGRSFEDVVAIPYDNGEHYISFEVVSNKDYLHEDTNNTGLSRGTMCTSIDALIIAKDKDGCYLLPIEWKYTESYDDIDKSLEPKRGETRLKRYEDLRHEYFNTEVQRSLFYIEPFYQLMRQTIWAEEVIRNNDIPFVKDYIHIHVVPSQNSDLLYKKYPYSEHADMIKTWKSCLKTPEKYCCIDPSTLVDAIENTDADNRYHNLVNYLRTRYNYKK